MAVMIAFRAAARHCVTHPRRLGTASHRARAHPANHYRGVMAEHVVCLVTTPTHQARPLAEAVVRAELVASVNIVPLVRSVYRSKGEVELDDEALLIIKTTRDAVAALRNALAELHPSENFELVALDVVDGAPAYLGWITDSVRLPGQ
jgi:periplasmic divalent cation tolerance protein